MKCPLEPEIKTFDECADCYGALRYNPCPADLMNPRYCEEYLKTTPEKLQKDHPEWNYNEIIKEAEN